jgi:hypothetical protein
VVARDLGGEHMLTAGMVVLALAAFGAMYALIDLCDSV